MYSKIPSIERGLPGLSASRVAAEAWPKKTAKAATMATAGTGEVGEGIAVVVVAAVVVAVSGLLLALI